MNAKGLVQAFCLVVAALVALVGPALGAGGAQASQAISAAGRTKDFSVWLIPRQDERNYAHFQRCIEDLSSRHGIPAKDVFVPHVTIYWGRSTDVSLRSIAGKIKRIAATSKPITLTVAGMGATRERFKSLFLTFTTEPMLHKWSGEIGRVRGVRKTGYVLAPHLSLFYPQRDREMPFSEKAAMMNYVAERYGGPLQWFTGQYSPTREFDKGYTILFDRIQLRREDDENEVGTWVLMNEYTLGGTEKHTAETP